MRQLVDTMHFLHTEHEIIHRDLKPENLLLSSDYQLKIADFGLSTKREPGTVDIHMSGVGTRQYQAPEILEGKPYEGTKVDVFSIGVIIFVMVTGALPYYKEASLSDPIYKYLCQRENEKFW